jgi:putative peptidoglycan lipid II flippase
MLISLVSLFGGILNSLHKFWVNAAAPILLNLTLIVALLGFHSHDPLVTARIQAIAVSVSGALQLAWLAWACRQNGVRLALRRPRLNPDVKKLVALIWPAAAGAGRCRSTWSFHRARGQAAGAWQRHLYLHGRPAEPVAAGADRHWPGHRAAAHDLAPVGRGRGCGGAGSRTGAWNWRCCSLPATMALVLCGEPIAAALFGYGRYTAADTHFTAQALAAFSIGLPSYILVKVLTPGFYAARYQDAGALCHDLDGGEPGGQPGADRAVAAHGAAACHRDRLDRQCRHALSHAAQARAFHP